MNPKKDLILNWRNHGGVRLSKIVTLPQFDIGEIKTSRCDAIMYEGKWNNFNFLSTLMSKN